MLLLILCGSGALVVVLVALAHTLRGDGYGMRPAPRSHDAQPDTWVMPHDEILRRGR